MIDEPAPNIAVYYDPDGYTERTGPAGRGDGPAGLMGRQVAGREFLDAYLTHGRWDSLAAVVKARERAEPLIELCRTHPSSRARQRRLHIVEEAEALSRFAGSNRPADLLYFPNPPDARFAWMRHATAPGSFALCGITHTLCTPAATAALCDLLIAPFEPYDCLVCTSQAVVDMVRAVTGSFANYIHDRFGVAPTRMPRLERIPLGVNLDRFRPPKAEERSAARARLGVADDEVLVLCVGRLSHHAKAHPFPVFIAAQQAARQTGCKVHLMFAGWAAHRAIADEYRSAAHYFAPAARVSFVDGQNPEVRAAVWPAADVFVSLPDNIQETFGLVVVEAMASGLPVVGSDWDGYRDLIASGETGYLVPTRMVRGATTDATARLLFGQVNYDHFVAGCSQAVAVNSGAAGEALARLVGDAELRRSMGAAGRRRAEQHFGWEKIIRAYETLWSEQIRELNRHTAKQQMAAGPARFPAPEVSFAVYPTIWLDDNARLQPADDAAGRLPGLLTMPLTSHSAETRCHNAEVLARVIRESSTRTIGELATELEKAGASPQQARATVAWLLKYGLLIITE